MANERMSITSPSRISDAGLITVFLVLISYFDFFLNFELNLAPVGQTAETMTSSEESKIVGVKRPSEEDLSGVEKKAKEQKRFILAIDIERQGGDFDYGILAIGVCFGEEDGTILKTAMFAKPVPGVEEFDKKCWDDFWSKNQDVLVEIGKHGTDNHIQKFREWLAALEIEYGPFGRKHQDSVKLKLASDNPAYDLGHIMVEFNKIGIPRGVAECFDDYVPTDDPSEQERGLTKAERAEAHSFVTAKHTHNPVDDATGIFQLLCGVKHVLEKRAKE